LNDLILLARDIGGAKLPATAHAGNINADFDIIGKCQREGYKEQKGDFKHVGITLCWCAVSPKPWKRIANHLFCVRTRFFDANRFLIGA
jgi:hypothetical protein